MSDEEYDYDYDSEGGDGGGYDYGSDGGDAPDANEEEDELVEIENAFYEADYYKTDSPMRAIELFEKVVKLESARGSDVKW